MLFAKIDYAWVHLFPSLNTCLTSIWGIFLKSSLQSSTRGLKLGWTLSTLVIHIPNSPNDLYSQVLIWPPPAWFEFSNKGSCVFILITSLPTNTSNFTICLNINLQLNYITYTWNYHKMKLSYINNKLTCKYITKLSECVPRTFP